MIGNKPTGSDFIKNNGICIVHIVVYGPLNMGLPLITERSHDYAVCKERGRNLQKDSGMI